MSDRITLYKYNGAGYFTGEVTETNIYAGISSGWTDVPLPEIPAGKYAFFNNVDWEIRDTFIDYVPPVIEPVPNSAPLPNTTSNTAPPNVI